MTSLGVGSVVGAFFNGKFTDKVGLLISGRFGLIFWIVSFGCFILAL